MNSPLARPAMPGALSDDELRTRSRAVAVLLQAATLADGADPLSGYRDLLRETLQAVQAGHGTQAALSLIVDELVRALDDPAQIDALIGQLTTRRSPSS